MENGILVGGNIEEQILGSNIDTAFIVSGLDDNFNMHILDKFLCSKETIIFLGSSGVGKSTIINYILGNEVQ